MLLLDTRLGNIRQDQMMRLARDGLLEPLTHIDMPICEYYLARKTTKKTFGEATRVELHLLSIRAIYGTHYFITFIDYFTRFGVYT